MGDSGILLSEMSRSNKQANEKHGHLRSKHSSQRVGGASMDSTANNVRTYAWSDTKPRLILRAPSHTGYPHNHPTGHSESNKNIRIDILIFLIFSIFFSILKSSAFYKLSLLNGLFVCVYLDLLFFFHYIELNT